jgi:hypothetical protein
METYEYNGKTNTFKECGIDYTIVYEFTCTSCNHKWRSSNRNVYSCPKCQGQKLYYISKRSCDEFFPEDAIIQIPIDSELM